MRAPKGNGNLAAPMRASRLARRAAVGASAQAFARNSGGRGEGEGVRPIWVASGHISSPFAPVVADAAEVEAGTQKAQPLVMPHSVPWIRVS